MNRLARAGSIAHRFTGHPMPALSSCYKDGEVIIRIGWPSTWATLGQFMQVFEYIFRLKSWLGNPSKMIGNSNNAS
jgi:hypothetical protein